ncbi:4-(cytidine 5'-diphospho)-2-C-methyl-D-erythritol kinase [Psychrobacter lutiphocae]|uniref:4-(cytidine 5'-diphospho)-2-C-methyl-D-erythritol kinase n=1 Tax=Psychrobacter lutiphocae TaxID=540500 RepID=UPI0003811C78|nr:4-(cytidine 5'-diphospho)-2-C-methyl-D-erythritol kinase [Psychrobacter lutiphocae]
MTPITRLSLFSPAKINLFLHIIGKRDDGYHNLQTVFRLLDWGDQLTFSTLEQSFDLHQARDPAKTPIRLTSNLTITNNLADNLITKAAIALLDELKTNLAMPDTLPKRLPIIDIKLHKKIPTGAGLGGGSSNAATTLIALNQLWTQALDCTPLKQAELIKIGATVGADVPIFVFAQDAIAEGIGDKLTAIKLPAQHFLLLHPQAHASTQNLFQHPNLRRDMPALPLSIIKENQADYLNQLRPPYCNVFEAVMTDLVPEVCEALSYLQRIEVLTSCSARMTGTGSCVYLPIKTTQLDTVTQYLEQNPPPCDYVLCQSLQAAAQTI